MAAAGLPGAPFFAAAAFPAGFFGGAAATLLPFEKNILLAAPAAPALGLAGAAFYTFIGTIFAGGLAAAGFAGAAAAAATGAGVAYGTSSF